MKTLTISPRFFQIEKKNYTDWKFAFFRELFQNGLDAGASKIECFINPKENNKSLIQFRDNGRGMSENVLENVFLAMGETTKNEENGIGGFGKARNLTAFSSDYYIIFSNNYICNGVGASYEITKNKEFVKGVIFEALVDAPADELITRFKNIVFLSRINASVYLNGENLNNSYRTGTFCREMECGRVYANKSNSEIKNKVIVRVNGLVTFTNYTAANAGVTVEIHAEKSREILSATRDSLNYKYKTELDQFLGELAADTQSALKDRSKRFIKYVNKAKGFLSRVKEKANNLTKEVSVGDILPANQVVKQIINSTIVSPTLPNRNVSNFGGRLEQINNNPICPILESMVIYADTNNENVKKVIKFYDPTQNDGKIGSDRHKFLRQWKNICEIVAGELSNMYNQEYMWAIGVCFDDEAVAMHMKTEGISYIMINPVTNEGKMKYSLNSKSDITKLTISAIHEFVHAAGNQLHNQDFVICYDGLLERVMPRLKDIFHAAADAKN